MAQTAEALNNAQAASESKADSKTIFNRNELQFP